MKEVAYADYAWHVRGVAETHLGPLNSNLSAGLGAGLAVGQLTYCALWMDMSWVPGFAPGPRGSWVAVCATCERNFRHD